MSMRVNSTGVLPPPASHAVEATALVKHYGEIAAVRGVDLRIESGEVFGFLGPNGAVPTQRV